MKQLVPALFAVSAIMALTGAAVYITGWNYAPYIYTIGAGFIALAQVNTPVKGKSKILFTIANANRVIEIVRLVAGIKKMVITIIIVHSILST